MTKPKKGKQPQTQLQPLIYLLGISQFKYNRKRVKMKAISGKRGSNNAWNIGRLVVVIHKKEGTQKPLSVLLDLTLAKTFALYF